MLAYPTSAAMDTTQVSPSTMPPVPNSPSLLAVLPRRYAPLGMAQGHVFRVNEVTVGTTPLECAVAANGLIFVSNNGSSNVSVIHPGTLAVIATIAVGVNPWGICYVPTTNRIYVACNDAKIYVIDPDATGVPSVTGSFSVSSAATVGPLIWIPGENCLYLGFSNGAGGAIVQKITALTTTGGTAGATVATAHIATRGLCYCPSNHRIYTCNTAGPSMNVINPTTNASVATVSNSGGTLTSTPVAACYCPVNDRVYVVSLGTAAGSGSAVHVVRPSDNACVASIALATTQPSGICFNPANGLLYVSCSQSSNGLVVVNPTNNTAYVAADSSIPGGGQYRPAFSPHIGLVVAPYTSGGNRALILS